MNFSQINFGLFAIKIYGFILALAFFIAIWHFYRRLKTYNLSADFFVHFFWKWLLTGIFTGRLLGLLLEPQLFVRHGWFSLVTFWEGGFHFFGFLLGFLGLAVWQCKKENQNIFRWLDAAMPSMLMGILIIDLGSFLTGAIYGKATSMPWGIQYETFDVDILEPVHPVTLYGFVFHTILFLWAKKHKMIYDRMPGKLAIRVGFFFFLIDFFLQFFRGDYTILINGFIRIEMLFDLLAMIGIVYLWIRRKKKGY